MAFYGKVESLGSVAAGDITLWTHFQTEIANFIAAVNPNNTGREITAVVLPSTITSDNYRGFTLQFDHPTLSTVYYKFNMNNSTSSSTTKAGYTFTPTINSGSGDVSTELVNANLSMAQTSNQVSDTFLIWDDTSGQELFYSNWRHGSNAYIWGFFIAKDDDGEWMFGRVYDSSSELGHVAVGVGFSDWSNYEFCQTMGGLTTRFQYNSKFAVTSAAVPITSDPVADRRTIIAANTRLGSDYSEVPLQFRNSLPGKDIITLGCRLNFDFQGLI